MFTVKLMSHERARFVACDGLTVFRYDEAAIQVSVHGSPEGERIGPFYVGTLDAIEDEATRNVLTDEIWYDFVEIAAFNGDCYTISPLGDVIED